MLDWECSRKSWRMYFFSVTVIPGIVGTSLMRTQWLKQLEREVTVEQTCEAQLHQSWQLCLEVCNLIP